MSRRLKISLVTLVFLIFFTVVKFVFYYFSGSITVLSESLHSFSDAATTLLVMIAVYKQQKKTSTSEKNQDSAKSGLYGVYKKFRKIDSELKAAFLISIFLLVLSFSLFKSAFSVSTVKIENALPSGIIFIVFSFFSYFLYSFQISAAEDENSAALKADGLHTRADMLISMITGISLLLYYEGFNFDRYFAAGISIYIFIFSMGLFISSVREILGFSGSCFVLLNDFLSFRLGFSQKWRKKLFRLSKVSLITIFFFILLYYLSTAFFIINADEEALLFRFGRLVNKNSGIKPGLHFCFPWPIDRIVSVKTSYVFSINAGNKSSSSGARIWTKEHGDSMDYISGDNNFFLPYTAVHFRIKNPVKYYSVLRSKTLQAIIENITANVLSLIFAENSFYDISINKREEWVLSAKKSIQSELDKIDSGVEITGFFVNDLHPPVTIAPSFEDVVASIQVKERYLHMAGYYSNLKLSQARINSLQTVADAEMYRNSEIETASGESEAYLLKLDSYKKGWSFVKNMLMLRTAEKVLSDKNKIIINSSAVDKDLLYYENYILKRK